MLGKLFGGGAKPKPQAAAPIDAQGTIDKLDTQCKFVAQRIKKIEGERDQLKRDAVAK